MSYRPDTHDTGGAQSSADAEAELLQAVRDEESAWFQRLAAIVPDPPGTGRGRPTR